MSKKQIFFTKRFDPTIEDIYNKEIMIDDKTIKLQIMDTFREDEILNDQYIRTTQGFIYIIDIKDKKIEELHQFIKKVLYIKDLDSFPFVIFFNKSDLEEEKINIKQSDAEVIISDLKKKYFSRIPYFYGSAKTNNFVIEVFQEIVYEINAYYYQENHKPQLTK